MVVVELHPTPTEPRLHHSSHSLPRQLYVDTMATTFYPPISHNDLLREEGLSAVTLPHLRPLPLSPSSRPQSH